MAHVVLVTEGIILHQAVSDSDDVSITVIDLDTDGIDGRELKKLNGHDVYVTPYLKIECDPEALNDALRQVEVLD
jgi:hypothetical protein